MEPVLPRRVKSRTFTSEAAALLGVAVVPAPVGLASFTGVLNSPPSLSSAPLLFTVCGNGLVLESNESSFFGDRRLSSTMRGMAEVAPPSPSASSMDTLGTVKEDEKEVSNGGRTAGERGVRRRLCEVPPGLTLPAALTTDAPPGLVLRERDSVLLECGECKVR
jgi:hypothetical protein